MSLKFGLNVKKKGPQAAPARRPNILGDDEDYDGGPSEATATATGITGIEELSSFGASDAAPPAAPPSPPRRKLKPQSGATGPPRPPSRKPAAVDYSGRTDASTANAQRTALSEATDLDASIFDYDSFHDAKATVTESKKAAARQEAKDRKPKYIDNLLDAAAKRKQDQQIAREKLLLKERENEGEEFADKEKFVTSAYKAQQAETRQLEAEQKARDEESERRRREGGGGMQGLYRGMMEKQEREHEEAMEAARLVERGRGAKKSAEDGDQKKTDAELAAEMRAKGVEVEVNEEGVVTDKRQLLSAGLNVAPKAKDAASSDADRHKAAARQAHPGFQRRGNDHATRERQTKMMEEQLAASAKRAREEEEEERVRAEKAAKSQKTTEQVSDAKARYLARKAAKERGEA